MALLGSRRAKKKATEPTEAEVAAAVKKEAEEKRKSQTFDDFPHLLHMKPSEHYIFRSDYFEVDDYAACVLGFFHDEAANEYLPAFWGISRIPFDMPDGVTTVLLEQVRRESQRWVEDKLKTTDRLEKMDAKEQSESGSASTKRKSAKIADDNEVIAAELQDGAAYLHIHMRMFIKAPTLELLEESIERLRRTYVDALGTLSAAPYHGSQRQELSTLFAKNDKKRGKGFHLTSPELAGSHSIVTHGVDDPTGTYIGDMRGDVNNSAVIFDVNKFTERVVVADGTIAPIQGRQHRSDMWGSKISQQALLNGGRAVHIVLDGANLDLLGPKLGALTSRVDMSSGDVNMFEMFGDRKDALNIFPAHMQKLVLMANQVYATTDADRAIIQGQLEDVAKNFYIDKGMWYENARANFKRLRIVGIPHTQVPRLQVFVGYLTQRYEDYANRSARDDEMLHAYSVLRTAFQNLLSNNGDLFNTYTNDSIDGARLARRVIYDFAQLQRRGTAIAMAQLVNIVSFAVDTLGEGDVVIIHGAENISDEVKPYMTQNFKRMMARGGRVAYLYNDIEKMLDDQDFNKFDVADYTILGPMSDKVVKRYTTAMDKSLPPTLEKLITQREGGIEYLRRGVDNVVFSLDLPIGVNPERANQRAAITERLVSEREKAAREAERRAEHERRLRAQAEADAAEQEAAEAARPKPRRRKAVVMQRDPLRSERRSGSHRVPAGR